MIDFVGTPQFLRMALRVAMVTMHFHIAPTGLFFRNIFNSFKGPREQFDTNDKLYWCAGLVKIGHGVIELSTNFTKG